MRVAGLQDWRLLRDLRLEALADHPIGFLELLEQAVGQDDAWWQERAQRWTGQGCLLMFAERDGVPVAMTGCRVDDDEPDSVRLLAVWVRPVARGSGVLDALVDRARIWAGRQGATWLRLSVHEDNARARRAYARLGFTCTGARVPYAPDPSREELGMVRPV